VAGNADLLSALHAVEEGVERILGFERANLLHFVNVS
jgi:hypothetical protein